MKRFGFPVFLALIGLFSLIAPSRAEAQGDSGCWNTVAQVWYPTGTVVPSGSRCLGGNIWELRGKTFVGGPWPLPNTQVVAEGTGGQPPVTDPLVEQLVLQNQTLISQNSALLQQIGTLNQQLASLQPVQPAIEQEAATPRLLKFISERPASFAIVGVLVLLAIIASVVALIYYQRHPRLARPETPRLATAGGAVPRPIHNPRPDGVVVEEMPTDSAPWGDGARPPAAAVYVVDDTPLTT